MGSVNKVSMDTAMEILQEIGHIARTNLLHQKLEYKQRLAATLRGQRWRFVVYTDEPVETLLGVFWLTYSDGWVREIWVDP